MTGDKNDSKGERSTHTSCPVCNTAVRNRQLQIHIARVHGAEGERNTTKNNGVADVNAPEHVLANSSSDKLQVTEDASASNGSQAPIDYEAMFNEALNEIANEQAESGERRNILEEVMNSLDEKQKKELQTAIDELHRIFGPAA